MADGTITRMRASELVLRARRSYYGWLIVGVVFLASGMLIGTGSYAFGLFVEPLEDYFDWQRTAIQASLSFMAVGSLTGPLIGRVMDRHGARLVMSASLVVFGLSFLLRPLMTQLWHWYALSFVQFVCFNGAAVLPTGRLVSIWFPKTRGRVMGIATMGNNFGGATMPHVVFFLLAASWQTAFVGVAAISFVIAMMALLFVHESPGLEFSGAAPGQDEAQIQGSTVREALSTRAFYAMTVAMTLGFFSYSGVLPWVGIHLSSNGLAESDVPRILSVLAIFGMAGKAGFGYLAERITARRAMMLSLGGQIVFMMLMVWYPTSPMIWASVPLFGLFMGAWGALISLIVLESFGLRSFGTISGLVGMATAISLTAGPLVAGASFDFTESYGTAFTAQAIMFAVGIVMLVFVKGKT